MKRLLLILIAAVTAWLGVVTLSAPVVGATNRGVPAYGYDSHVATAALTATSGELGAPEDGAAHLDTAAGSGANGASRPPSAATAGSTTTYDTGAKLVQIARATAGTTHASAQGDAGALLSLGRSVVAANAVEPSAQQIIQSTARAEAAKGAEALSGSLSAAERAAMAENPGLTNAFLGQAVHRNTAAALEESFPGRFWYRTRGPDFVDRWTGEMLELTTPGQVGSHLSRPGYANVTMCTYVVPSC